VGQLIAETIHLYGDHFLRALPLGLVVALADQAALGQTVPGRVLVLMLASPLFSAAFTGASAIVAGTHPGARRCATAIVVGTVVFLPAASFFPWFAVLSVAVLALLGNAVPAIVFEGAGPVEALKRAFVLARADIVHAVGGLATLVIIFGLTRQVLAFVLRSQGDNTVRVSVFLADTVLGPILFLGAVLLYLDLAARVGTTREERKAIRLAPRDTAQ